MPDLSVRAAIALEMVLLLENQDPVVALWVVKAGKICPLTGEFRYRVVYLSNALCG